MQMHRENSQRHTTQLRTDDGNGAGERLTLLPRQKSLTIGSYVVGR